MLVTTLGENSCSSFDLFRVTTVKQILVTTLGFPQKKVTTLGENVGYFMFCWLLLLDNLILLNKSSGFAFAYRYYTIQGRSIQGN
jgi:hypothetical protein